MKVFITGANGFVGKRLQKKLASLSLPYVAGTRELYGDLEEQNNWKEILKGMDVVVHLAARVHVMNETNTDPLSAFRNANVVGTLKLAVAAKSVGVKRFIFISSVKVNGEETFDRPFSANDRPAPQDPYGVSKLEAERELMKLHQPGVFEIVVVRPPLVYGPGVKANFEKLFWLVKTDLPIPFSLVKNKRSLVSVDNLVDLIVTTLSHPKASGEIFLVSDDLDYSLKDLIEEMGKVLGKSPHLLPIPVTLMKIGAKMLGKKAYVNRLFGNLHVDIEKTKTLLNWKPPYTFQDTYKF